MRTAQHDVVVIGAGPAGLCAAAELHALGLDVALFERRPDPKPGSRAIGVHPPTLAALEPSGATERILAEAARIPRGVARTREGRVLGEVRFDRAGRRFPYVAAVPQAATEAALAFGVPAPERGADVQRIVPDPAGAIVLARSRAREIEVRARAVVVAAGASGRDPLLRDARARARAYEDRYLMTDLPHAPEQPDGLAIITLDVEGVVESFPLPGGGRRLVVWDGRAGDRSDGGSGEAERLRRAVATRTGEHELAARVTSATAFGIRRVLLPRLRRGPVFVIGDAAHEVSPIGGQGMNLGLLDAVTLAPALATWLQRGSGSPEAELRLERWERYRLASARTAARLAGLNTSLGRARSPRIHRALTVSIGAVAAGPVTRIAARAYTMGCDRHAAS
jgi:2-polyprenyl-6-methoxyphenol hydroxylase-like FAD-dependent oxidoreductase